MLGSVKDDTTDGAAQPAVIRRVAVLGTGIMGTELVRNLLSAGFQVQGLEPHRRQGRSCSPPRAHNARRHPLLQRRESAR